MAPMTPSNTARAGGILFPITLNVARVFGSEPGPTASRIGSFLLLDALSGRSRGVGDVPHGVRAQSARRRVRAPGIGGRGCRGRRGRWPRRFRAWSRSRSIPYVGLPAVPAGSVDTIPAPRGRWPSSVSRRWARCRGRSAACWSCSALVLLLWIAGEWLGDIADDRGRLSRRGLLLLDAACSTGRISSRKRARWDVLVWFGGLMMLAGQLEKAGFPEGVRAGARRRRCSGWPWMWALVADARGLSLRALRVRQPGRARDGDVPGVFRGGDRRSARRRCSPALAFGVFSNLNAAMTHYGTGPAPIVFGAGYCRSRPMVADRDSSSRSCTWRSGCRSAFSGGRCWACGEDDEDAIAWR